MTAVNDSANLRWGVVGGGIMGLALARRLVEHGQRVTILEAAPEIGGLAGAWQVGDIQWDRHYHVTLLSDLRLRQLLRDIGLEQDMQWVETKTGFYTNGRLYSMSNTVEFLKFPPLRLIDKLRLGLTIFAASKRNNWKDLESVLVGDWLRKWSGLRTFEKIWEPLLLAKLGECYRRTSAAFIWATIARMYRARQSGLKKEMFGYAAGGYARVLARLVEDLKLRGVEITTDCRVTNVCSSAVRPKASGDDNNATRSYVEVSTNRGEFAFDRLVFTTPSPLVAHVCPQLTADERRRHETIEYLGVICASVVLTRPLSTYYVTNITDRGFPFTAVIEMTTLVDRKSLRGRTLVYLPRYAAADDPAWTWTDEELQSHFLVGLRRMYPELADDCVTAFRVSRARHVMALPTLNYSDKLPPMATSIPGVFVVNSAHIVKGTLNVNEVLELADNAFEKTLAPSIEKFADDLIEPNSRSRGEFINTPEDTIHDAAAGELVARP